MKSICRLIFALICLSTVLVNGAEVIGFGSKGELKLDKLPLAVHIFDENWKSYVQIYHYFNVTSHAANRVTGEIRNEALPPGVLTSTLDKEGGEFRYHSQLKFNAERKWKAIALATRLPVDEFCGRELLIDGKGVILPVEHKEGSTATVFRGNVSELIVPLSDRRLIIRGKFELLLQDDRAYNINSYVLRISFKRDSATDYSLNLNLSEKRYESTPLDLRSAVNMGFTDEKEGDRKGGWTDQGKENDLRMIPVGKQRFRGVDFDIIDPAGNDGKSCLMLAGPHREYFPKQAEIKLTEKISGNYLYLLHAIAWPTNLREIGQLNVTYADGTSTRLPVTGNVDVGNWWEPAQRRNGEVVWTGENRSSYVGLFRSVYKIENKPVAGITFSSTGLSVWGIVAASISDEKVPRVETAPVYVVPGKEWKEMTYTKETEKNSALDFSYRLDAPAGKYGPLITDAKGKLVFRDRPELPVRFYGANLCSTAQYLSKEWAERLADRMAAAGYNAIRLHHQDGGLSLRTKDSSTALNPAKVDQLDYLIHCFKQRGIYITIDMYVSRPFAKGEIPEFPDKWLSRPTFKPLAYLLDSAMENWKEFSRNWLTHVNPYTGMALKDDPVLLSICLINEGNLDHTWKTEPFLAEAYNKAFDEWLKTQEFDAAATRDEKFSAFLTELHIKGYETMKKFIRGLGVQCPLSDMNMRTQPLLAVIRDRYDYVDNHQYWNHPTFPETAWKLPSASQNTSVLAREVSTPAALFPSRIFNKPMMITEFDYAYPNICRAEGAVVMGGYAAMQDWNALFQFAYAHQEGSVTGNKGPISHFDTSTDPVKALSERIAVALFLDGDLKPAPLKFAVVLDGGKGMTFGREYSKEILRLGTVAQVGTVVMEKGWEAGKLPEGVNGVLSLGYNFPKAPAGIPVFNASTSNFDLIEQMKQQGALPEDLIDLKKGVFNSSNHQLFLNSKEETLKAVTPKCEALVLPAGKSGEGSFLKVANKVGRGVFSTISLDGKPLGESKRVLLLHLTDCHASKTKFGDSERKRLEAWGTPPYLAARGEAEVTLTPAPGSCKIYALDATGKRLGELSFKRDGRNITFAADIFGKPGAVPAYELVVQ